MWTKEQIARWKQGKFLSAERQDYKAWVDAGRPAYEEPKKEESQPTEQANPLNDPNVSAGQVEGPQPNPTQEEQPAQLSGTGPSIESIQSGELNIPTGTNFTGTTHDIEASYEEEQEDTTRYDAEGESYEFPEWAQGFEDTAFGDFISDIWREGRRGFATARGIESTMNLATGDYSESAIAEFVQDQEAIAEVTQSAEMRDFQGIVEQEGGGFWGVMKGLWNNPSVAPQIIVSSLASMMNAPAVGAGATVYGGITAVGSSAGPIGTALSQIAAVPAAVGTLSAITDGSISYVEFMREELGDKEFNEENVQAILSDKEAMSRIRGRAAARGIAVGLVDGLTMGVTRSIGGSGAVTRVGRAVEGATSGLSRPGAALVGTAVEGVGGATGEATAQVASGQEINVADIVLEGIAEVGGPGTIINVAQQVGETTGVTESTAGTKPTGDSSPSADISTLDRPVVETVSELQSEGIIREDVSPTITEETINRITTVVVNAGLETAGIEVENATHEQIEAEIPRIKQEVVTTLQSEGVILENADIESQEITDLIERVTVEAINNITPEGVEITPTPAPTAEETAAPQYTPTVETVNEIESSGIISEGVDIEAGTGEIQRVAVRNVLIGLEQQGIQSQDVTIEAIEAEIPRIDVETVTELQEQGIISEDISPEVAIPIIQRIAVDTVNEIKAQAIETEQVEIAHQEITAEINAPRVAQQTVNELETAGLEVTKDPSIVAAVEIIPQIVVEEVEAGNTPTVEAIVEETVNEIVTRGVVNTDVSIETIIPVIERIATDIVNELTPAGLEPIPTPKVIAQTLNAEALDVGPEDPQYSIGEQPVTESEVMAVVDGPIEELATADIDVVNNPPMQEYVNDQIQRAQVTLEQEPDTPNLERVVSLELGLRQYENTTSTVGKLRKGEITKRIKNIASGVPETDGIVVAATETAPAKQSILPDSSFTPVPRPEKKKQVAPSIEENFVYNKKTGKFESINPNKNFVGELSQDKAKLQYNKPSERLEALRTQVQNITRGISDNKPTGNEFYVVAGGTSPDNLRVTRKIAAKQGLVVTQHPINPGEFLVHEPGAKMGLRDGGRFDGVPFGAKQAIQFLVDRPSKNRNEGLNMGKVKNFVNATKKNLKTGKSGLIQDVQTLSYKDLQTLIKYLKTQFPNVDVFDHKNKRTGRKSTFIEYYNKDGVQASVSEAKERSAANKSFLNKAVKVLKQAFPDVEVVFGYEQYANSRRELILDGVDIPEGTKGFVYEGKVYLNPLAVTKDTPFHEFGHVWLKALAIDNRAFFNKGFELLKGTEYMRIVNSIPYYQALKQSNPQAFKEEVMANALGKRAADIFESVQEQNAWKRFVDGVVRWLKAKLNIASQNGYRDLNLDEWLNIGAQSILTGDQTVFNLLSPKQQTAAMADKVMLSIPEFMPDFVTPDDVKKAKIWIKRNMDPPAKYWKIPEFQEKMKEIAVQRAEKRLKKEKVQTTKEPLAPALEHPAFKKIVDMFADMKKKYANNISKATGSVIKDISNERIARSLGKMFQDFEDGDLSVQMFYSAAGKRAYPKRPEGVTNNEFKKMQMGVGALMLQYMIENGILDLDFSYRNYLLEKKQAKKKKSKIPADAGYVVVVNDLDTYNGLADSVALYPSSTPDFKEVFVGEQKPKKQDKFRGQDGLQLVSRDQETNRMSRESHPDVYKVKDKADSTRYVVDKEYLGYFKEILNLKNQKLVKGVTDEIVESKVANLNRAIMNLERIADESFASAHNFVHNGRLMNTSTDVSHQSSKNVLAAYTFQQQDPQGAKGWEWMQVLTQDTYGYSGTGDTRADRLAAAERNQEKWMEVAADPMSHVDYIMKADVPMLFLRHILEMKRALETEGGPQNYKSGLPAHMDATTSGIQILAGITKDPNAARIANLTATDERSDSYSEVVVEVMENRIKGALPENSQEIYNEFQKRHKALQGQMEIAQAITDNPEASAAAWSKWKEMREEFNAWKGEAKDLKSNVSIAANHFWYQDDIKAKFRKIFKKPVMTKYYSGTQGGMADALLAQFADQAKKEGDTFYGINKSFTSWIAGHITKAADTVFDGPGEVLKQMVEIAKDVVKADSAVTYNNPVSGFTIVNDPRVEEPSIIQMVYKGKNEKIHERNKKGILQSKIVTDSEEKSLKGQKKSIAPLIVHSLDAALVHYVFLNADFPVQTIHDSFATTPAHTQDLYHLIRQGFYEITKGDTLLDIMEQIYQNAGFENYKALAKEKFNKTQVGGWDPKGVLENQYAFSAGVTDPNVAERIINKAKAKSQPQLSLAESFETEQIEIGINHEVNKIAEESKPCK